VQIPTDKALTRVRCSANGVQFWSTVYLGLEADEQKKLAMGTIQHEDMDDDEDERRMQQARVRGDARRNALSLDNPTIRMIQELQKDAALLSVEGYKKMQANDFSCVAIFTEALQKLETAVSKIEEMGGDSLVSTQVDTVQLHEQISYRLQQATRAQSSHSELRKIDREEREINPTGAIDLRGREGQKSLAHRALSMGTKSVVQGVVRVSNPTLYSDFDPAQGLLAKPPKLRIHQTVDALE
jgi:hypothetical protein